MQKDDKPKKSNSTELMRERVSKLSRKVFNGTIDYNDIFSNFTDDECRVAALSLYKDFVSLYNDLFLAIDDVNFYGHCLEKKSISLGFMTEMSKRLLMRLSGFQMLIDAIIDSRKDIDSVRISNNNRVNYFDKKLKDIIKSNSK